MSKKIRGLLILAVLLIVAGWLYQGGRAQVPFLDIMMGSKERKLLPQDYEFKPVVRKDIRQTVLATGTVTLKTGAEVKIGARVSGQLRKLNVQIGDHVKAGKVIAVIEQRDLLARVAQRTADVRNQEAQLLKIRTEGPLEIKKARAQLDVLKAQLELAKKTLERNTELNKEGIVANSVLEESAQGLDVLRARIVDGEEEIKLREAKLVNDANVVEATSQKSKADLQEAEAILSYTTITATIDGLVSFISTQEGETVVASLNAPTFVTLVDLKKLQVTSFVDETDIGRIQVGQKAVFTVDSYPEKAFKAVVYDIHPKAVIKDNVVNYEVMLDVDKEDMHFLRPDMTTNVVVTTGVHSDVLAIPKDAVKRVGDKSVVVAKADAELVEKPIVTGWRDGDFMEIKSGVNENEQVGVLIKPKSGARGGENRGGPPGSGGTGSRTGRRPS